MDGVGGADVDAFAAGPAVGQEEGAFVLVDGFHGWCGAGFFAAFAVDALVALDADFVEGDVLEQPGP